MKPADQAAVERVSAGLRELAVARLRFDVAAYDCAGALRNFVAAFRAADQRAAEGEALAVAAHPDLAELNVRMDALYEPPAEGRRLP